MTEAKNDGGPAFPRKSQYVGEVDSPGMTLREWYAGKALVGLPHLCAHDTLLDGMTFEQHVARNAYKLADAMIEARGMK